MTRHLLIPLLGAVLALSSAASEPLLPAGCHQLILGLSKSWEDSTVSLTRWERPAASSSWQASGTPWNGRLGKNGSAWGRGEHPAGLPGPVKTEGDGRAPAGLFRLGDAYGCVPAPERNPSLAYHRVGTNDLWVEDPSSPLYNRHLVLPQPPRTPWELKQQMRQDDPAHALKLFIAHNAPPRALAGAGSAIFFHIWREEGRRPSTGCTVMPETDLRRLIAWIDPASQPCYVLLPRPAYEEVRASWGLPQVP